MLNDITFGQYYPTNSCVHKMDARIKILIALAFMVFIFCINTVYGYGALFVFTTEYSFMKGTHIYERNQSNL